MRCRRQHGGWRGFDEDAQEAAVDDGGAVAMGGRAADAFEDCGCVFDEVADKGGEAFCVFHALSRVDRVVVTAAAGDGCAEREGDAGGEADHGYRVVRHGF